MQESQYQTDALDQYFDALLRNPDTPPPAALDSETAAIAKALVDSKSSETADERTKDRVWSRVLFATYAPPELEPSYTIVPTESPTETASVVEGIVFKRKPQRLDVPFLVAAVFAVFCLTGLFVQYTDTARDSLSHYQATKPAVIESVLPRHRFLPGEPELDRQSATLVQQQARETAALTYYTAVLIPE